VKLKIANDGGLWLERAGVLKKQYCPFNPENDICRGCGDWCPLFGEKVVSDNQPDASILRKDMQDVEKFKKFMNNFCNMELPICNGKTFKFVPKDFTD